MVNEGRGEKGRELEAVQSEEFAILEQHPCGLLPQSTVSDAPITWTVMSLRSVFSW